MYIDTNYGHRWSGIGNSSTRRPGGLNTGLSFDTGRTGSQWKGSQSIKYRSRRQQQQMQPSQSTASIRFNTTKSSVDWGNESGIPRCTSSTSSAGSCNEGNGIASRFHESDEQRRTPESYIDHTVDDGQPRWLSPHVVKKIQELFERRVLHICNRSNTSKSSSSTDDPPFKSSHLSDPLPAGALPYASKYQLIAAFLVNKGIVEAWHIYSLLPVESNRPCTASSTPFLSVHSGIRRRFELTQRRRRLLQRYYSGARQYVVLYVNNSCSEHYLPVGKVSVEQDLNDSNRHTTERQHSTTMFLGQSQRLVSRLFTSILTRSRSSRPESSCFATPSSDHSSGARATHRSKRRFKRNLSLPSDLTTSSSFGREDSKKASTTGREALQPNKSTRTGILRRLLEHFWLFGTDNRSSSKIFSRGGKINDLSAGKSFGSDAVEEAIGFEYRTGDTSSIGLMDLSSTPESSTTSEHTTTLPTTVVPRYQTEADREEQLPSQRDQSITVLHSPVSSDDENKLQTHGWNGVWLPKR